MLIKLSKMITFLAYFGSVGMFWGEILPPLNYYQVSSPYYLIPWGERPRSEKTPCMLHGTFRVGRLPRSLIGVVGLGPGRATGAGGGRPWTGASDRRGLAEATIKAACWAHGQSELVAGALVHISRCPNFVRRRTTSGGETVHRKGTIGESCAA